REDRLAVPTGLPGLARAFTASLTRGLSGSLSSALLCGFASAGALLRRSFAGAAGLSRACRLAGARPAALAVAFAAHFPLGRPAAHVRRSRSARQIVVGHAHSAVEVILHVAPRSTRVRSRGRLVCSNRDARVKSRGR